MRKIAIFTAAFALAVLIGCFAMSPETAMWWGCGCALLGTLPLFMQGKTRTRGLLLALGAAAGFFWFALWTTVFVAPALKLADTTASVTATVMDYPVENTSGVDLDVRLKDGTAVRLYIRSAYAAAPGDRLTFTADFERADLWFEEKLTYYTARGVFLLAYADAGQVERVPAERVPLLLLPRVWAHALSEGIRSVFSAEDAALLHAVTLGDKTGLTDGTISLFNRSGLAHLLVVSGLHVSILLWGLTRVLAGNRWLKAGIGALFLVLFTLMVGCTPSAVRAAVMNLLLLLAPFVHRENDPPTSLAAALLFLLIQNPYAAANVSLQLSFASVAGILLVSDPLYRWFVNHAMPPVGKKWICSLCKILWSSLSVTLGAMLFTTPIIALWFGVVSILAPVSNLLCLWAITLLLLGGFLSGGLALLSPVLAAPAAWLTGFVCRYVRWVAEWIGSLPFAALALESIYYRLWLVMVYGLVAALFLLRRERRKPVVPLLCAPVLLLCAAFLLTRLTYTAPPLTVAVLDVGQGASTAFYSEGAAALVDCGGSGSEGAGDVAADYFQSFGVSTLDLLIFTHLDSDHFNGADELFARMEIKAVALPDRADESDRRLELEELAQEEGAQVLYITEMVEVSLGACTLTIYPPLGSGTSNEEGLFVLCSAGSFDTLITGDADSAVEAMLIKYYDIPDVELLVVGHHGSNGSTSEDFLAAVRPEYAVISVGHNSYGHPHEQVLERLTDAGSEIYRTDQHGTVTISISGDGASINEEDAHGISEKSGG